MVAVTELPKKNKKVKRKSKIPMDAGVYVVVPQPKDMPKHWEVAIATESEGSPTGQYSFHNAKEGLVQAADPRPHKLQAKGDPLPAGWTQEIDEVQHNK